jgi:hypothetical protein
MSELDTPEAEASFSTALGHLIRLLRQTPDRAEEVTRAVETLAGQVARRPALVEAGIENSWAIDGDVLKERLILKGVDQIQVAAGASAEALLALAKALADDETPIPSSETVRVDLIVAQAPAFHLPVSVPLPGPLGPQVPRARPGDQLAQVLESLLRELARKLQASQWHPALHDAQAAIRLLPGLTDETRRTFSIALRRLLTRPVLEAMVHQAYRISEEQPRTAEVLRFGGVSSAEIVLELLRQGESLGPRGFLVETLGQMPESLPLIIPLLRSDRWFDLWIGAEVVGRIGRPEVVQHLVPHVNHPDERVRHAVIDALGRFRDKSVTEALRRSLGHRSPVTRARAGMAMAARGSGAMAMPLLAAIEEEREPTAWRHLLTALARIDAPEAGNALVRLATLKRGLLRRSGHSIRERLLVVEILGAAGTGAARQALERIANEADEEVAAAAEQTLAGLGNA